MEIEGIIKNVPNPGVLVVYLNESYDQVSVDKLIAVAAQQAVEILEEIAAAVINVGDEVQGRIVHNVNMQIVVPVRNALNCEDRFGDDASFRDIQVVAVNTPCVILLDVHRSAESRCAEAGNNRPHNYVQHIMARYVHFSVLPVPNLIIISDTSVKKL